MNRMCKLAIMLVGTILITIGCSKEETNNNTSQQPTNLSGREQAVKDYKEMYLTTAVTDAELAWTGNSANCNEGTISKLALDRSLVRLNYFRKICGLPYNMVWNESWFSGCQKAALMMYANNSLSHFPPNTWKCFSQDGYTAAGISNIALGSPSYHSSSTITGWVEDEGASNYTVGHRRWILFSRGKEYGLGCTTGSSVLHCIEHTSDPLPANSPAYIAYPPTFIPQSLVFDRWSLAVTNLNSFFSGVDLSAATIKMTDSQGGDVSLKIVSKTDNGYADQTIVWEPVGINTTATTDIKYHVVVDNFTLNGVAKKYEYDVNIIKP